MLLTSPEKVDSTIVQRAVLNRLDNETNLQWLAYESPKRLPYDFLVLTTEESYGKKRKQ
jgi:hypothetical protein